MRGMADPAERSDSRPLAVPYLPPRPVPPPRAVDGMPLMGSMSSDQLIDVAPPPSRPRTRTRRRTLAVLVAIGVVVGGVAAALALRGSDDAVAAEYSLTAAAQSAESAQNVAYEMSMDMGEAGSTTATGRMDVERRLLEAEMSMPALGGEMVDVIFNMATGTMYLDTAAFEQQGIDAPTPWLSFDTTVIPALHELMQQGVTSNPLSVAHVFDNAQSVEDLGIEDFRDQQVKHYHVTASTATALAAFPTLQQQVDAAGGAFPAEMEYDVYITGDSQLRRVTYDMDMAGQTINADIVYTSVGTIEPIELPLPEDVTDMTAMLIGRV